MRELVRLSEVAQINPRFDKSSLADDALVSFVPMAAVGAADGLIDASTARPFAEVKKGYTPFREGDVLFAKVTPCMENGKMAVARGLKNGVGFGSSEFHVLRPSERVDAKYLYHFVSSESFRKEAARHMTGAVGLRRVPTAFLSDAELPLVDLDEQRRIVAEIDKQFSRLDEAVANLQRVKANLKRYKAAVLKASVEGRLVETEASLAHREGRGYETAAELIGKTPTPPRPNRFNSRTGDVIYGHGALAVGIPAVSVPEGWQWVNLVEIAKMESGHTPSRNHPEWWDGDVPWIGIADARDHHEQVILRTLQNTNEDGLANSAARLLPAGTVCVSRTASVGYVVVMGRPMATSQDFVNWVPTTAVTSDWLRIVFSADREALIRFGKGSVHKTIYFPEWLSASIALPPLAEQRRIAAEVDRRISVLRSVEAEVSANLRRAQSLRQSVLQFAFSEGVQFGEGESVVTGVARNKEHASVVIAARVIAQLCDLHTFGRVKLQKLLFLSTHHARIDASNDEYLRMQAGPLDMQMLQGVLKRLDQLRWFREKSREQDNRSEGAGYFYERLSLADDYKAHLNVITGNQLRAVDHICQALRTWSTEDCELLATVYAVWNDLLLWRHPVSDDAIVEQVHEHWHESKKRFSSKRIVDMKSKLTDLGLEPTGFGRPTAGSAADSHSKDLF